jgi:predicted O-methyltransferase YrrM
MHEIVPVPWIPYIAIEYLNAIVRPGWQVFEWGSGGSTIYWMLHCARVTSIEHDLDWYKAVQAALAEYPDDRYGCDHRLIPGELDFQRYAEAILEFPDESFDLVFVDGRARIACIHNAHDKVKPGGWLLLDNSDMQELARRARVLLATWTPRSFLGHGRGFAEAWEATLWRKGKQDR